MAGGDDDDDDDDDEEHHDGNMDALSLFLIFSTLPASARFARVERKWCP